ncbi:MAG: hypothetical protein KAR20_26215, partial [Candidatus Heimdallarchaeota archaeon]|nr:hypothetical protein [Candidatus Heimdallarchaeota archaeon]
MAVIKKKIKAKVSKPKKETSPKKNDAVENDDQKIEEIAGDDDDEDSSNRDFSDLIAQIQTEQKQAWWYIKPKWDEWALRIKLYNNQKRDKSAVGDNTLFTIFQTVLADLYSDTLDASFVPRESGDEETAENLSITAKYDHDQMEKDQIDYEWDWESLFFGRGLLALMEFDRENLAPVPEVWHVMTVLRDPFATSVNG